MTQNVLSQPVDAGGSGKATRPFTMIAVLGAPGNGKSSYVDELVVDSLARGRDVRILDPGGAWPGRGEWPDAGPEDTRGPEERAEAWITALRRERRRGGMPKPMTLVLDDADTYLGGGQPRGVWRDLFTTFRHWRVDIVVVARRTADVPKIVFTSSRYVVLFTHREVYSRDYLSRFVGADAVRELPREPFVFLFVDVDTGERHIGRTRKRTVRTAADG